MKNLQFESIKPAMARAMAARDRQVVVCVFAGVILFHVALLVVGQLLNASRKAAARAAASCEVSADRGGDEGGAHRVTRPAGTEVGR